MEANRREVLLTAGKRFFAAARNIRGVTSIALIGSMTTPKRQPKDIDFLLTISRDADWHALATISRRLKCGLQSFSAGADVFLASPDGEYLGRVCLWRTCEPGIRRGCMALNCGRQQYLYDDLDVITLPSSVVQRPALVLWPTIHALDKMPPDVAAWIEALPDE
jgi:hypothetical protein